MFQQHRLGKTYQRSDDFAVGMCLEVIWCLQFLSDDTVVIDLAVDGQGKVSIFADEGLSTGVFMGIQQMFNLLGTS